VIEKKAEKIYIPEPFEEIRIEHQKLKEDDIYVTNLENKPFLKEVLQNEQKGRLIGSQTIMNTSNSGKNHAAIMKSNEYIYVESASQMHLFEEEFIEKKVSLNYKILGQLFDTYWLLAFEDKLFIVDQHAAHEKVKYEHLLEHFKKKEIQTQTLFPPVVISLHGREESMLLEYLDYFRNMGFEIEEFGGNEYAIRQIPMDLYGSNPRDLFYDILNEVANTTLNIAPELIYEKLASMSCKAAVKGNTALSEEEFKVLMDQLLVLENPYHCPHGRPTIISMTKYEIEKKFKRIV
jgi:DNA mismatch repair protein MutL